MAGATTIEAAVGRQAGRVARCYAESGYAYLVTEDGRELFFDRADFAGELARLAPGDALRFDEVTSPMGPRAANVALAEPRRAAFSAQPPARRGR